MVIAIFALPAIAGKIASTIMRLTGLPDIVARFQNLSAVTGTGFTTREPELIVNYPIARRVLTAVMVIGNLGLVPAICRMVGAGGSVPHAGNMLHEPLKQFGAMLLLCKATER